MRQKGLTKAHAIGVLLLCVSLSAPAQEQKGISIGQLKILPTLGLSYGYDDNIARSDSGTEIDSYFYTISPGIRLELPSDESIFSLTWQSEYSRYEESSQNDYEDWGLRGDWVWDPTSRTNISLFGSYSDGHVERGEGTREGDEALLDLPLDEYESLGYGASWSYGAVGSRGRIHLDYSVSELDYTNNSEFTEQQDRESESLGATFFMRIRPKTSALIGVRYDEIDYKLDSFAENPTVTSLDGDAEYFFVGFTWDVTARTSGRVDFGWHEKHFDDPGRTEYDSNFWRATVDWALKTYSTFNLTVSRDTLETVGYGDYILRDEISLGWNHSWGPRFSTTVEYGIGEDDPQPDPRKDDFTTWGISGRWQINDNLQLGGGWQHYERDTNLSGLDYDKNIYLVTLEISL